jgi:purine-binding chemotaxis protein CheW
MDTETSTARSDQDGASVAGLGGKYMTFKLAEEVYGLEILSVREIIGLMTITRLPRAPDYFRGVINLRGKVIPVMDLRARFGMNPVEATDQTVIIVVHSRIAGRELTMGLLVDLVLEVSNIGAGQIEPPPDLGSATIDGSFIRAVGKTGQGVAFLLDTARILSGQDADSLAAALPQA